MVFALPDLGGFVAAALLLIIALAIGLLATLIAKTLGRAPVIGGWVSRDLVGWMRDAANAVLRAAHATWHFAAGIINWAENVTMKPFIAIVEFAQRAWTWITYIRDTAVPDALLWADRQATSALRSAEAEARTLYDTAERDIARVAAAADHKMTALYADAVARADQLYQAAERNLQAGLTVAEQAAAGQVAAAARALSAGIAAAEQTARLDLQALAASSNGAISSLAGDVLREVSAAESAATAGISALQSGIYTDLAAWGDKAVTVAWPDAAGDLQALRRAAGADFPWLSDLTGLLAGAGTAGLLGALIRSMATSQALTRLAADCTVPTCRNLSQFGQDLQALAALVADGLMFAWLADAVTDPSAWSRDAIAVLGPVASTAADGAKTLLGVA